LSILSNLLVVLESHHFIILNIVKKGVEYSHCFQNILYVRQFIKHISRERKSMAENFVGLIGFLLGVLIVGVSLRILFVPLKYVI